MLRILSGHGSIWPLISTVIFFAFFCGVLIWALRRRGADDRRMERIMLADDGEAAPAGSTSEPTSAAKEPRHG